jgi:hypothetical protein
VFEDEQLGQVPREPTRLEVAPVRADRGQERLADADLGRRIGTVIPGGPQPVRNVRRVERRPVDGRPSVRGRVHAVARHHVDLDPVDRAAHVRVFGVRLAARRQDGVPDACPVRFEVVAAAVRRETEEDVNVAGPGEPRVAGGAADVDDVGVDREVGHRVARPPESRLDDRLDAVAFGRRRTDARPDRVEDGGQRLRTRISHGPGSLRAVENVSVGSRRFHQWGGGVLNGSGTDS